MLPPLGSAVPFAEIEPPTATKTTMLSVDCAFTVEIAGVTATIRSVDASRIKAKNLKFFEVFTIFFLSEILRYLFIAFFCFLLTS